MDEKERERLARRALGGDKTAALKWHAVTPGRATGVSLPATRFPGTPSPFGPLDVEVQVEVDDEGNVYVSANAFLERGSFSCSWILIEDERTVGRHFSEVHPLPASDRGLIQRHAREFMLSLEPMVLAWIDASADRVGTCFVRVAAERTEWASGEIERLRRELARAEGRLADRVVNELKARRDVNKPWRFAQ